MPTAKSTRATRGRSRSRKSSRKPPVCPIPPRVEQHIGQEVGRLYRASALLNVLEFVANYTEDNQRTVADAYYLAQIAGELIGQAINGLDVVALIKAAGSRGAK